LSPVGVSDDGEIEHAIAAFARESNGGLIVVSGASTALHRHLIIMLAARHRLAAVFKPRAAGYHTVHEKAVAAQQNWTPIGRFGVMNSPDGVGLVGSAALQKTDHLWRSPDRLHCAAAGLNAAAHG